MKISNFLAFCYLFWMFSIQNLFSYDLPAVNLGVTSFLDGLPLPKNGWWWEQYLIVYNANKFLDGKGQRLGGVPSPKFNYVAGVTQVIYQSDKTIFGGKGGFTLVIPELLYSHVQKNTLNIETSGSGFGDLLFGGIVQWDLIKCGDRPIFANRLELDISFPTGKNKEPEKKINPGNNVYFINPYWAGTLYFTPKLSTSWRLHYLWVSKDPKTHIQAGQAVHLNFSAEYQLLEGFFVGLNGYYLQQLQNSKLNGKSISDSRERVLGLGPGLLYLCPKNIFAFGNFYFESHVRNRTQGVKGVLRVVWQF